MKQHSGGITFLAGILLLLMGAMNTRAGETALSRTARQDTMSLYKPAPGASLYQPLNLWGIDVLVSNDGFGMGTFFRRQFSEDFSGFVSFSMSESKDDREVERFDPFTGLSYVPGKLNRFLVLPLLFGVQYRLFREDIVDTFRPYVNAGAGPTMIYMMPFVNRVETSDGTLQYDQVDFFKSIGRGHPHYTAAAFVGFGANFGTDKANVFGVNFRYYFTYLYSSGLPSLFNPDTGEITGQKTSFGGFFITLNVGLGY